jgi:autotransporter-associated beta strand protein
MTVASSGTVAGLVNVNGGTIVLGSGAFAATGGNGASTMIMTITNGSMYSTNGGNFAIAQRGAGTVTLTGGLLQCGNLVPATGQTAGGNGVVNLNGGTLICTNISVGSAGANAWGTVNYNGGTLKPGTNSTAFFTRLNLAPITNQVQVGGAIIDTAGFGITFNSPLITDPALGGAQDGGLTKLGAGTLTLSAANSYNGTTTIGNGTLLVSGSLDVGDVNVGANGTLAGTGTIGGQVTVTGTLAPGTTAATGKLTVSSNVTLNATGTNVMKLNQTGATNDVLSITGTLTYGGTLSLTNLSGTLTASSTFKLFSAGTYSGAFTRLLPSTPGSGLGWNTNTLSTDGILRVVATVNTTPTNITAVVSGNQLNLSWPADHTGWRLQVQTNTVSVGLRSNWVDVAGSTTVNSVSVTINPANGSVFFRMVYP